MKAEIVGVGTELLLGQIANTNAQKISQTLATIGVDVYFHTVVGDNLDRASATIRTALDRSDAVLITGGLGPTPDDLTRAAVAAALDVPLRRDDDLVQAITSIFARLNRPMPEENLRQADLPEGAIAIAPEGTAPGFYIERNGKVVFALPGVPGEMEAMLEKTVVPLLRERIGEAITLSREVLVIGLGESLTHERISDIVAAQSNPTIAYLAGKGQVRVRLTAKAPNEEEAGALIDPVDARIRERLGEHAVPGHHFSLAAALGARLRELGATVAVAESLTGGLLGAEITNVPGSSAYFLGSIVCYSDAVKRDVVGVDPAILDAHGSVSAETASALADGVAQRLGADLGVAATGVAGPGDQDGIEQGTIFVAASWRGRTEARRLRGYGDRANVRAIAVTSALDLGRRMLPE